MIAPNIGALLKHRFERKVRLGPGCMIWTGAKGGNGYGQVRIQGQARSAVSVAYEIYIGPIPPGLEPDHSCRTRQCVNVAHLELVTHQENVLRGESPCAVHARKTTCKYGHAFDEQNTKWIHGGKHRDCRACLKRRNTDPKQKEYRDKNRVAINIKRRERRRLHRLEGAD